MDELRNEILALKKLVRQTKFMNDDRRHKLVWLLECMEDILLEEELTQMWYKDIRGGEAV